MFIIGGSLGTVDVSLKKKKKGVQLHLKIIQKSLITCRPTNWKSAVDLKTGRSPATLMLRRMGIPCLECTLQNAQSFPRFAVYRQTIWPPDSCE